ncbi:MAG: nonstructural protein [Microvirus sp.]|nr:MAG: nonstructural protein [Microvirus sp.]
MKVVVAIKDTAARVFGTPFFVVAAAQAIRSLKDEVNSKDSTSDVNRHPSDFELYELGHFNDDSGALVSYDSPVLIARAKDLQDAV